VSTVDSVMSVCLESHNSLVLIDTFYRDSSPVHSVGPIGAIVLAKDKITSGF